MMSSDPFERLQQTATPKPLDQVNQQVQSMTKKGSKISPKIFLIGCGSLFMIFLLLIYGALYFAASSGDFLQSIGMQIEEVRNILKIFAGLFFGLLFVVGAYLLFFSIYKVATVKERRGVYAFGLIGSFLLIGLTIVGGVFAFTKINQLAGKQAITSNSFVLPFVQIKGNQLLYGNEPGLSLIAPVNLRFQLNREMYDRFVLPELGNKRMTSLILDCGNGQTLSANQAISLGKTNSYFPGSCFYLKKGAYPSKLTVNYQDPNSGEKGSLDLEVPSIILASEITLDPIDDKARINDEKTEYILGTAPLIAQIRATKLFTDLQLGKNRIDWDMDGNGQADVKDNTVFKYPFNDAKLHTVYYRLPEYLGFETVWFEIPVRVEESEVAGCELQLSDQQDKAITVTPKFDELVNAKSYKYSIKNLASGDFIEQEVESPSLSYIFPKGGQYEIAMKFYTSDGKKGSCGVLPIEVGFDNNSVVFDLLWRQDDISKRQTISPDAQVSYSGKNMIFVKDIPTQLRFDIKAIQPDPTAELKLFFDDRQIFSDKEDSYELSLAQLGEKNLRFEVTTKEGKVSNQEYTINVERSSVKAIIKPSVTVGEDPLEVELDASISPLYDETDEIVYFTWDYGDGQQDTNTSQGKVKHIYKFDASKQEGRYFPKVTVTTKKGSTDSFVLKEGISVKKQQREAIIRIESHPTQQARLGDVVKLRLQTDGIIKKINWNFGQGKVFSCEGRSCLEITTSYEELGEYSIRAEIEYQDSAPVVTPPMKVRVFE